MGKIRILPLDIVAKISAGEVIERPAYAVKELIENALDAGATHIKVSITESGLKQIIVTDDGEGMDEEDLKTCYLPHTTSKLSDDNLQSIHTLGFRGEALASIAAISDLEVISRIQNSAYGMRLCIKEGKGHLKPCGAQRGTTVIVNNLFKAVPARRKFLKSPRTELRQITELLTAYALSHPDTAFTYAHNQRQYFDLSKHHKLIDRIRLLLGPSLFENLIPVEINDSYINVSGFICKPQVTTTISNRSHIFINKRRVFDALVSSAVKEAYGSLIEPTVYPIFILYLDIPPDFIDVNVHPRKEQIAYYNSQFVFDTVTKGIGSVLAKHNLTFYNLNWKGHDTALTHTYAGKLLKETVLPWEQSEPGKIIGDDVIQVHNLYLLCQTVNGIVLFDQHAASERILYDQFSRAYKNQILKQEQYHLPASDLLELSLGDSLVLTDNLHMFKNLGFSIVSFGETTFKIEAVPALLKDRDYRFVIAEIIEDILQSKSIKDMDTTTKKMIEYLACRSAIKAGDRLTKQQSKDLIKQVSQLDGEYTCPHGRPLKVEIPLSQFDSFFKRR